MPIPSPVALRRTPLNACGPLSMHGLFRLPFVRGHQLALEGLVDRIVDAFRAQDRQQRGVAITALP